MKFTKKELRALAWAGIYVYWANQQGIAREDCNMIEYTVAKLGRNNAGRGLDRTELEPEKLRDLAERIILELE